jgi:hypothetical protein
MKKYKVLFFIVAFFLFVHYSYAQNNSPCDSVVIRGYVVAQFKKQEMIDKQTNEINGFFPIDNFFRIHFLPFNGLSLENNIDSINKFRPEFKVFLPTSETKELINEFCRNQSYLFKNNFSLKEDSNTAFFEINENTYNTDLFKFYYIECKAIKVSVLNNYDNTFLLNIPYNKLLKSINCYFVYNTIILQQIEHIDSNKIKRFDIAKKINGPHEIGHSRSN